MNYIYLDEKVKFDYNKAKMFFHCRSCIEPFMGSELHESMTPREYGNYEIGTYDIKEGDTTKEVVVAWCKRCQKEVWNSQDGI